MILKTKTLFLTFLTCLFFASTIKAHHYETRSGIAGNLSAVGSNTMATLLSLWAEEFQSIYPQVNFQLQTSGSGTAPPALIFGSANIGPMSRNLKESERLAFLEKYGYEPTLIPVALDAIILFVDQDNPIDSLTQKQIDAMFSVTRFCGGKTSLDSWQQLSAAKSFNYPIRMFGRSAVSGTYGLFKKQVLCDGDFKANVAELPGSPAIVQSVAFFKGAIGYAAWGGVSSTVKPLAIQPRFGTEAIMPSEQSIKSYRYPYTRTLYLLLNKDPASELDATVYEFIRFIYSEDGQALTRREGYVPLESSKMNSEMRKLRSK